MPSAHADRDGLFTCPHTGVALAALDEARGARRGHAGQRVVVISTASGLKFADFKVGYHEGRLTDVPAAASPQRAGRAAGALRRRARGAESRASLADPVERFSWNL